MPSDISRAPAISDIGIKVSTGTLEMAVGVKGSPFLGPGLEGTQSYHDAIGFHTYFRLRVIPLSFLHLVLGPKSTTERCDNHGRFIKCDETYDKKKCRR